MQLMDFSFYKESGKYYGGSEKKIGILIEDAEYMLKFQKSSRFGLRNNHLSEFIGSHIFQMAGFWVQETYLGQYKGNNVVACKDFNDKGRQFVPFNDVGESTLDQDKETYQYEYQDIMQMLRDNSKLTNVGKTIEMFWELYIMDAFLGNFDRHGGNWGFIKENNRYTLAPVFDNGSCLYPNLTDEEEMEQIMTSREETEKRIFTFPTSQVKLNGVKSSYYEVINSHQFKECDTALKTVFNRINMEEINRFIDSLDCISDIHKKFYRHILKSRYELILKNAFEKIV